MQAQLSLQHYESSLHSLDTDTPLFYLSLKHRIQTLKISMHCKTPYLTTNFLPKTTKILKQTLPTVLLTECFNSQNLPFAEESKNTEIAHLFEHILLEYLCLEKISQGHSSACFSGRTHWNWIKYPKGSFFITITIEKTDLKFLSAALEKSISLLEKILNSAT